MKKFLNWMAFIGSVCKAFAKGGREVLPEYEELKKHNLSDRLMQESEGKNA